MTVTAPYNFVPLSGHVFLPEDRDLGGAPPAQDTPIDGGVSGVIHFSLSCDTPLLVAGPDTTEPYDGGGKKENLKTNARQTGDIGPGGADSKKRDEAGSKNKGLVTEPQRGSGGDGGPGGSEEKVKPSGNAKPCDTPPDGENGKKKSFMTLPDGTPAIPGSSLRGMIRTVLEIASFGKMQLVDDKRTTVRDLSKTAKMDYQSRVSGSVDGAFAPRSFAGYLHLIDGAPHLIPCEFGRIEHGDITRIVGEEKIKHCTRQRDFHAALQNLSWLPKQDQEKTPNATEAKFVERAFISTDVHGSDHCPVGVDLSAEVLA